MALNDNPQISEPRRREIKETARVLGYRPNPMASALGQRRHLEAKGPVHAELAWLNLWPEPARLRTYQELNLYWEGAYEAAERCGYRLEEFVCHNRFSPERFEAILLARGIRGILIPPHAHFPQEWKKVQWEAFHVVRFGYSLDFPPGYVVAGDHLASGCLAFESMYKRGYRRIGYVATRETTSRTQGGFLLKQLEQEPEARVPVLLLPTGEGAAGSATVFREWLDCHRPDAIFTDISEIRTMLAAEGRRVPEDIGLATTSVLDGNADSGIYQNSREIGKTATETLVSLINHHHSGNPMIPRKILIEGHWVNGSSLPLRRATRARR
jgi:LacI family transcriptional regulator/LacI family repressor for deo operon, udp, cdd, tsx, nupC, and nupG